MKGTPGDDDDGDDGEEEDVSHDPITAPSSKTDSNATATGSVSMLSFWTEYATPSPATTSLTARSNPLRAPSQASTSGSSSSYTSSFYRRGRRKIGGPPPVADARLSLPASVSLSSPSLVCGRQEQTTILKNAYQRVCDTQKSEVVVIHGKSGVGKSVLVDSLREYVVVEKSGFFVGGKYDQLGGRSSHEPYSALVAAFTEICDFWLMQNEKEFQTMKKDLQETLGSEVLVLTKLISNLELMLRNGDKEADNNWDGSVEEQSSVRSNEREINERSSGEPDLDVRSRSGIQNLRAERDLDSAPSSRASSSGDMDAEFIRKASRSEDITSEGHFMSMSQAFVRFKRLCKIFLRVTASKDHPVLLFLDDLQWVDEPSVEVLNVLLADGLSRNILLVLTYRDDDPMAATIVDELRLSDRIGSSSDRLPVTDIPLGNLNIDGVQELLKGLLLSSGGGGEARSMQSDTDNLCYVLMQKTEGNAYFLVQLLESLKQEGLLWYNDKGRGWEWDLDRIQSETNVADNILELVFSRVHRLKPEVIDVLKLAAYLGFKFDVEPLLVVTVAAHTQMQSHSRHEQKLTVSSPWLQVETFPEQRQWLEQILNLAAQESLIEPTSTVGTYKFAHDRVQQCLYEIVPSGNERDSLHLLVGLVIWRTLVPLGDEPIKSKDNLNSRDNKNLFLAADHLKHGYHLLEESRDRLEVAELNRLVGNLALMKSAFATSRDYLLEGIGLLGSQLWGAETYELSLDLHCMLAEVSNSIGNFSESEVVSRDVLQHTTSFDDKVRAYWTLVDALGGQGKHLKAAAVGFNVLRLLGVRLPRRPTMAHVGIELARTLYIVTSKSHEELLNLPLMTDERKIDAMNMLGRISLHSYFNYAAKNNFVLVGLNMMRLSCRYGMSDMTPFGVANFAMVFAVFGMHAKAIRYGELALKMLDRLDTKKTNPRTVTMLNHFVLHWRRPLVEGLAAFERSYLLGMEVGDTEFAFVAAVGHIAFMFYASKSVANVEIEASELVKVLTDFNHRPANILIKPSAQIAQNLMGLADDPLVLTGEVMNEDEIEKEIHDEDNIVLMYYLYLMRLQLGLFFEDTATIKKWLPKVDRFLLAIRGHFVQYTSLFMCGLCCHSLYRETGRRRYKARGRSIVRILRKWTEEGCMNAEPFYRIIDAERLSLLSDKSVALDAYDKAIEVGRRNESIIFEAMCHERAGIALASDMPGTAEEYMTKAVDLWTTWDAAGKVEQLERTYAHLLQGRSKAVATTPSFVGLDVG